MARCLLTLILLGSCAAPLLAQQPEPPKRETKEPGAKAEFRADMVPIIVEVEVLLAEWAAPEGPPKVVSELSGPTADVVQRIGAMEKAGQLTIAQHLRLTTVDGHAASAQLGERRPRVTGVTAFGGGGPGGGRGGAGMASSVTFESIGTLVNVTPHVHTGEAVTLELMLEKSGPRLRADSPVLSETPMGEKIRSESTAMINVKTAVRLANGQSAVVAGAVGKDDRYVAIVSVKVIK